MAEPEMGIGRQEDERKSRFAKWFQRDNLIIFVLTGILLFIIALPTGGASEEKSAGETLQGNLLQESMGNTAIKGSGESTRAGENVDSEYAYASYLEQKLKNILEGVSGVGKVEVMVTLQASKELVVEKDEPVSRSNTNEADSEGGSRIVSQIDAQETTIYRTEGSNSEPYVVKTILPKVEGVLVVAQGAGNGSVNKSITEIVQTLFDVEAHKVKVAAMEADK